jgi:hypothetical protein
VLIENKVKHFASPEHWLLSISPKLTISYFSTTTAMNTARAGRVGEHKIQLLQLAGSLDVVVAVVGEYPETWKGDNRFDQFTIHVLADPHAVSGQVPADQYQFAIEGPTSEAYSIVDCFGREHEGRKRFWDCTFKCRHAPLPSLYPNQNWTFEKGYCSYDRRRSEFGRTSDLDVSQAPDAPPMSGYESALQRLKVVVNEAVSCGLRDLRIVISATNPLTLSPHRFSDPRVREQQALINRCMQVCYELAGHVDVELRNVDLLRKFVGPTSNLRNYSFQDYAIPMW